MEYFKNILLNLYTMLNQGWVLEVFLILSITMVLYYIEVKSFQYIYAKLKLHENTWRDILIRAFHKPLAILILVLGITFALDLIHLQMAQLLILDAITVTRKTAIVALFVWFLLNFIHLYEQKLISQAHVNRRPINVTTVHGVTQALSATIVILSLLMLLQTLGFSISAILAFGGIGSMAIGFAAKDILANFLSGIMIYIDRPFAVGDIVRSPDRNIEGVVEYMGWRTCIIRTSDHHPLYVPNSLFSTIIIENASRRHHRRLHTTIGIRYEDAEVVPAILKDIKQMLQENDGIDTSQDITVALDKLASSSLNILINCFTKALIDSEFQKIQQDILLQILEVITRHGAECAFPTTALQVSDNFAERVSSHLEEGIKAMEKD